MLVRFTGHLRAGDLDNLLDAATARARALGTDASLGWAVESVTGRDAFLAFLEAVHDPATQRLSAAALEGQLSKRPQPLTLALLAEVSQDNAAWRRPATQLLQQAIDDLHDMVNGGFYYFFDPDQPYAARARETAKRLELNARFLLALAAAEHAGLDPSGNPGGEFATWHAVAAQTVDYVVAVLREPNSGLIRSTQHVDNAWYARRDRARGRDPAAANPPPGPPPVAPLVLAEDNALWIVALTRAARAFDRPLWHQWAVALAHRLGETFHDPADSETLPRHALQLDPPRSQPEPITKQRPDESGFADQADAGAIHRALTRLWAYVELRDTARDTESADRWQRQADTLLGAIAAALTPLADRPRSIFSARPDS